MKNIKRVQAEVEAVIEARLKVNAGEYAKAIKSLELVRHEAGSLEHLQRANAVARLGGVADGLGDVRRVLRQFVFVEDKRER